jgi:hypothetical protein
MYFSAVAKLVSGSRGYWKVLSGHERCGNRVVFTLQYIWIRATLKVGGKVAAMTGDVLRMIEGSSR